MWRVLEISALPPSRSKSHTAPTLPFVLDVYRYKDGQMRDETIRNQLPIAESTFVTPSFIFCL
jgi:hypothetical protein